MNAKANMIVSPRLAWNKMPKTWRWEYFKVVNAGNGQIALHCKAHNRFVRMNNIGGVDASRASFAHTLPRGWKWERFTVVNAGGGNIALHNRAHNRFVRMGNKLKMDVSPPRSARSLPKGWKWERFRIVQRGACKNKAIAGAGRRRRARKGAPGKMLPGWCVALHSKTHGRFARMNFIGDMDTSGRKAWNRLPRTWTWERFKVVKAGNGQVALHSRAHNRFVRMINNGRLVASPKRSSRFLPKNWAWERFTVVNAGNGQIALHNKAHKRFVRMTNKANMGASSPLGAKRLPITWSWERFTVARYGCPKPRKKARGRRGRRVVKRRPRRCRGCAAPYPGVAVRQYLRVGTGDFTLKIKFKMKMRAFTSASLVFSGGNHVGLDPMFTRGNGRKGSWKATKQHGVGPPPMRWHCLVIKRKLGELSGYLNGRYAFSRPMRGPVQHVDIRPVRNTIWVKDFYFQRGWQPSVRCAAGCGVKIGGRSLLHYPALSAQRSAVPQAGSILAQPHVVPDPGWIELQWTVDVVRSDAEGRENHKLVNLRGSSRDGFLLRLPNGEPQKAEAAATRAMLDELESLQDEDMFNEVTGFMQVGEKANHTGSEPDGFARHNATNNRRLRVRGLTDA